MAVEDFVEHVINNPLGGLQEIQTCTCVTFPHAGELLGISALINCPGASFSGNSVPAFVSVPSKSTHGPPCGEMLSASLWGWFILQSFANSWHTWYLDLFLPFCFLTALLCCIFPFLYVVCCSRRTVWQLDSDGLMYSVYWRLWCPQVGYDFKDLLERRTGFLCRGVIGTDLIFPSRVLCKNSQVSVPGFTLVS